MDFSYTDTQEEIRQAVRRLCGRSATTIGGTATPAGPIPTRSCKR